MYSHFWICLLLSCLAGASEGKRKSHKVDAAAVHESAKASAPEVDVAEVPLIAESATPGPCRPIIYRYPMGCPENSCRYEAIINRTSLNEISVEVRHNVTEGWWTAVGFSNDMLMPNSDLVLGYLNNSQENVHDMWIFARAPPRIDVQEDIRDYSFARVDRFNILKFKKTLVTGDAEDIDLSQEIFFLFPFSGGQVVDGMIRRHSETPNVSQRMSIRYCPA